MKNLLLPSGLMAILILACACGQKTKNIDSAPEPTRFVTIDRTKAGLTIYFPPTDSIELRCFDRPDPKVDSSIVFCCAAAFTADWGTAPSHDRIQGDHVSGGQLFKRPRIKRNTGAFYSKDSTYRFLYSYEANQAHFRSSFEKKGKENRILPGAAYIDLPIQPVDNKEASSLTTKHKSFNNLSKLIMIAAFNDKAKTFAREMYPLMVMRPECQRQFAAFLREVVETTDGSVFFHCTQGKDRTGLAAAFLLSALGIDRETVIADFDKTNEVYARDVRKYCRRVKFFGGKEEELAVVKSFIGANTDNFIRTLDEIDRRFGSVEAYLKGPIGLMDTDLQTLRERYLAAPVR